MNCEEISDLLKAIRDAVSLTHQKDDDIALPVFDPDKNDCGATSWCNSIELLAKEMKWSSIKTAAKAGKALKGSALIWFESWEPLEGRSWENFCTDIIDAYPEKKNLTERLSKAVLYTSVSVDSYSDYAREKMRLLRNTKIAFTDEQLIEIVCGGITDVDIRNASMNSGVTTTAELISLLSIYAKVKKRPLENPEPGPSGTKRIKFSGERKCFTCNQVGHIQSQCQKKQSIATSGIPDQASQLPKPVEYRLRICTYCKRVGHNESVCFHKKRTESTLTTIPTKEVNFLDKANLN